MSTHEILGHKARTLLLALAAVSGLLAACSDSGGDAASVEAPIITSQPLATTVNDGQGVSFTVAASGSELRYQWQRNATDLSGATTATLSIPAATLADSGASYRVVLSNGGGSVTSAAAVLTVRPIAPSVTTQPAAASVAEGAAATFSVGAAGSLPLAYQWRRNGIDIAGATLATYTLGTTSAGDSGATFSVRISNVAGDVTSNAVALIVNPAPVAITTAPQAATAAVGATASFSVVATGSGPLSYQWRRNGVDLPGATAATFTTAALVLADNGARYSVRVSNAAGSVTSAEVVLTVNERPAGFGSLAVTGTGVPAGYTFAPNASIPKAGIPPLIFAAASGTQQLNITMWSSAGAFTGVSIVAAPGTFGVLSGVNLNCNVGGTPGACDFAALRISVDEVARTITFSNSPIPVLSGATLTVNGTLRW